MGERRTEEGQARGSKQREERAAIGYEWGEQAQRHKPLGDTPIGQHSDALLPAANDAEGQCSMVADGSNLVILQRGCVFSVQRGEPWALSGSGSPPYELLSFNGYYF
jgi:hypothetical protein